MFKTDVRIDRSNHCLLVLNAQWVRYEIDIRKFPSSLVCDILCYNFANRLWETIGVHEAPTEKEIFEWILSVLL